MSEIAITREEQYLSAIAGEGKVNIKPITRKEMFLAKAAGQSVPDIEPITREEFLLKKIADNGTSGGSGGGGTEALDEVLRALYNNTEYELNSNVEGEISDIYGYRKVTKINLPRATSIELNAFNDCTYLTSVDLPNVTIIEPLAFSDCTSLTSVNIPKATSIGNGAFRGCTSLTSVDLPNITIINQNVFTGCESLISVNIPNAISIDLEVFRDCTSLASVNLPNVTSIGQLAFNGCTPLTSVDLPKATSIGPGAFGKTNLSALILRTTEQICELPVSSVVGTKIVTAEGMPTGEGFVYVPTALYEDYVANLTEQATAITGDAATAEYIVRAILRKIEDYPEITG